MRSGLACGAAPIFLSLLNVACAMLKAGTPFNPSLTTLKTTC
jgi:hypothetical protein